jgi:large subunit ribosomal protein L29
MQAQELRKKSLEELNNELVELRREQFKLRMSQASGELNRHTEHGRVRKDIARIKTVLSEMSATPDKKKGKKK